MSNDIIRDQPREGIVALGLAIAAATKATSVDGALADGSVMLLMTRDNGIVVAVTSNVAHANTTALALKLADASAEQE